MDYIRKTRPRILFLDQSGQLGGAELMLADVAAQYRGRCKVLLFADGPFCVHLENKGVEVEVAPMAHNVLAITKKGTGLRALRVLPELYKLVSFVRRSARDCDVIYANTAKALLVGAFAARLEKRLLVFHVHDIISPAHFSRSNCWLLAVAARKGASAIIANSEATRAALMNIAGRLPETTVIYNGFTAERFAAIEKRKIDSIREQLDIGDEPVVLTIGRLTRWKGQHVLLEAARSCSRLHVIILGAALFTAEDSAYERELRTMAEGPDLRGRIHFLGHRDDVELFYAAADAIVHCSIAPEPFGRVIVEGMLAGKPVIATDAGGAREIIEHPMTGILVAPNDSVALANALKAVLEDPSRSAAMAQRGRLEAARRFDLRNVLAQIDRVISSVVLTQPVQ